MNKVLIGPNTLMDMDQEMQVIKKNIQESQDRKKSYAYQHRVLKEFQVREHVVGT